MVNDEPDESRPVRRQVDEAIVRAREAKNQYQQQGAAGRMDRELTETLRSAAIRLYNAVYPHRDRDELAEPWHEYNLDRFGQLLRQRQRVSNESHSRLSSSADEQTRLAVATLSADELADTIDGLLECCINLGWAEKTQDKTVLGKGTIEDVRWLVNTREQSKAVEDLQPPDHRQPEEDEEEPVADGGVTVASSSAGPDLSTETPTLETERYPFTGPFFQLISDRKRKGQDAKCAVASANAETGVGKSTCAYYLAHVLDTSANGFDVEEQATLEVGEFLNAYQELPKGSALILDEAEQLTGRRAMSEENVKAAERWQMCRVREIPSLLTLPKFDVLDPLMKDLVDFRIEVERQGLATIYKKSHRPFGDTWWQAIQKFEYPDMDSTAGMQLLHELKDDFIDDGTGGEDVVPQSEVETQINKSTKENMREVRNRWIKELDEDGYSQIEIANKISEWADDGVLDDDLSVTQQQVSNILNGGG